MKLGFKKIHPDAKLPAYAHAGDAGMDVCAVEDVCLPIGIPTLVPTGLVADIPQGYELQVRPRSGLALKGVTVFNSPGTIDSQYIGPIGVILYACRGSESPEKVEANKKLSDWYIGRLIEYDQASCMKRLFMSFPREPRYYNTHLPYYEIHKGDRIAQLVLAPVTRAEVVEVEEVSETERGTGGFGSTGV